MAGRQAEAVAVGVNDRVSESRIVEGGRRALIGRLVEAPVGRPQPPQQLAELAPVRRQSRPSALGGEVPLVPQAMFLYGRRRLGVGGHVQDIVAADRD